MLLAVKDHTHALTDTHACNLLTLACPWDSELNLGEEAFALRVEFTQVGQQYFVVVEMTVLYNPTA